jgi:ABC-type multidrug transport system permease subunit
MTDSPGPYEAYPTGSGDQAPPSKPPVPNTINVAFYCYVVSTVIGIVSALLLLGSKNDIADQLRRSNTAGLTEDQIQSAAQVALIVAVVIALLFALVYLWLAFKLRAGRNWARITLTVLTALQVVSLATGQGGRSIIGYLALLLAVVGLVFAFLAPSNQYINSVKQARS